MKTLFTVCLCLYHFFGFGNPSLFTLSRILATSVLAWEGKERDQQWRGTEKRWIRDNFNAPCLFIVGKAATLQ